jgi:hypothetical protein
MVTSSLLGLAPATRRAGLGARFPEIRHGPGSLPGVTAAGQGRYSKELFERLREVTLVEEAVIVSAGGAGAGREQDPRAQGPV